VIIIVVEDLPATLIVAATPDPTVAPKPAGAAADVIVAEIEATHPTRGRQAVHLLAVAEEVLLVR